MNVPAIIAAVLSTGFATLADLATVLSVECVHDLLEMNHVDAHNRRVVN